MKNLKYKYLVLAAVAMAVLILPDNAFAATTLLLQQTPPQGGSVQPGIGLHLFDLNAQVTLTAVPKSGYQFVYWLGDVEDPTSSVTVSYLDGPKIIIAVFERVANEFLVVEEEATSAPNQGLIRHSADYAMGLEEAGGGKRPPHYHPPSPPEEPKDFPVPEPIPEPATLFLLGIGGLVTMRRCEK